jgi:WhiB family transcriptional regulator, redox-sensing transcriptional regulator
MPTVGESGDLLRCLSCGKARVQVKRPVADPGVYACAECRMKPDAHSWQERALCAETDPEAFFPEKGGSPREAKRICTGCEVRAECLEYALANDERFGIWGGLSERERRRMRGRGA